MRSMSGLRSLARLRHRAVKLLSRVRLRDMIGNELNRNVPAVVGAVSVCYGNTDNCSLIHETEAIRMGNTGLALN